MRTMVLVLVMMIAMASVVGAENQGDGSLLHRGTYIQGWSPNGLYSVNSATSATYNMTDFLAYGIYCASDCSVRLMPTSAKSTYPQFTVPGASWHIAVKNIATPFVNVSGAHQWQRQ